ncbi:hypothetical protein BMS3Abin03_02552 [bacterium BMS3Abin03]|nr:hypothetical protein BMS3Abin03_02552 [bacterium BMS3Abin03]
MAGISIFSAFTIIVILVLIIVGLLVYIAVIREKKHELANELQNLKMKYSNDKDIRTLTKSINLVNKTMPGPASSNKIKRKE